MAESLQEALVSVRVTAKAGEGVTLFSRSHGQDFGRGWSFDIAAPRLSGAEHLLGALAADVLELFARLAQKERLHVDEIEAKLSAKLASPLVLLGVIGAEGEPHYEEISLRAFVGSSAPEADLQRIWQEALRRAPLANTLRRAVALKLSLTQTY